VQYLMNSLKPPPSFTSFVASSVQPRKNVKIWPGNVHTNGPNFILV